MDLGSYSPVATFLSNCKVSNLYTKVKCCKGCKLVLRVFSVIVAEIRLPTARSNATYRDVLLILKNVGVWVPVDME